jgi:hypothetical protein
MKETTGHSMKRKLGGTWNSKMPMLQLKKGQMNLVEVTMERVEKKS